MEHFNYFVIARALHVVGVVVWIGGVAFVTTVLIPSLKNIKDTDNRLDYLSVLKEGLHFRPESQPWSPVFPDFICCIA